MGIKAFDTWAAETHLYTEENLAGLGRSRDGPLIGVDTEHFLSQFCHPSQEPLVPALGGFPMALEAFIIKQSKNIESMGCRLWFYFDGLDCVSEEVPFATSTSSAQTVSEAFTIYEMGEATRAIDKFRRSDWPDRPSLMTFAKHVLHKHNLPFVVAPFRAHAQMMHHLEEGVIDAIHGSSELFIYGADRIITKFCLQNESRDGEDTNGYTKKEGEFSSDRSTFVWIEVETCLKMLGDVSHDTFVDALLISGCAYIEAFPPLLNTLQYSQPFTFRNAVDLLLQCQRDIHKLCMLYRHDEMLGRNNWEDRFMRSCAAINHMIVLYRHDVVKPRSYNKEGRLGRIPRDIHEIIGLTLPEELQFYLYNGILGSEVVTWLVSGKIILSAPLAGGESQQYRKLVKEQLHPWRQQALALLAYSINRWYQSREIETVMWFEDSSEKFNMKDIDSAKEKMSTWRVQGSILKARLLELQNESNEQGLGSIYFAFRSLQSREFVERTMGTKPSMYDPLSSLDEIVTNVVWRFLYLRGYLTEEHELTGWGTVLMTMLKSLEDNGNKDQAEAVLVAVELIRLGLLAPREIKSGHDAPAPGSYDLDAQYCLLISRVSCTGKMRHPAKGYSGPLNRQLLAYHCLITEVRHCLKSLVEMVTVVLFLEGDAVRLRPDYAELSKRLPFQDDSSAGLGVVAKIYLDELTASGDPLSKSKQQETMTRAESWFIHIDVTGSFQDACKLWRAVSRGIETAGVLIDEEDKKGWADADQWLAARKL